jgi:hypothetical protein
MYIDNLSTKGEKPEAFKDRDDIEYYNVILSELSFINWGRTEICVSGQMQKGQYYIKSFIKHLLRDRIGFKLLNEDGDGGYFETISIKDALRKKLKKQGWDFEGEKRQSEEDEFVSFYITSTDILTK